MATALAPQILFVDFDGATLDGFRNVGYAELSSLSTLLSRHQLEHEEDRIIDVVMATLQENLVTDLQSARNSRFDLVLRNSRDDADPWDDPYVSRVIVGGTQQEIGRSTLGVAESIDVGNFDLEETAVVLLDRLTNPNDPGSPSSVPYAPPLTVADVIGTAIGAIAAHEAGHLFASFHTGHPGYEVDLMDAGEDPSVLLGYGPDGILGTSDDVDVDFNDVPFYEWEPFDGVQDSRNAIAYSLYQPVPTAIQEEPGILDAVRTTAVWPNPAIDRIHITMRAARPVDVRLSLYDVLGRRVRTQGHALRPGETRVVLPVDGLPAGVYLLHSDGVAGSAARAVIIAR